MVVVLPCPFLIFDLFPLTRTQLAMKPGWNICEPGLPRSFAAWTAPGSEPGINSICLTYQGISESFTPPDTGKGDVVLINRSIC